MTERVHCLVGCHMHPLSRRASHDHCLHTILPVEGGYVHMITSTHSNGETESYSKHYLNKVLRGVTYENTYCGFPISTDKEKGYGCIMKILDHILMRLIYMLDRHSKVKAIRVNLHFPTGFNYDPEVNYPGKVVELMVASCNRYNQKKFPNKLDLQIFWICEKVGDKLPHYHFLCLVNGHALQDSGYVIDHMMRIWATILKIENSQGYVNYHQKYDRKESATLKDMLSEMDDSDDFQVWSYSASKTYLPMIRKDWGEEYFKKSIEIFLYRMSYLSKLFSKDVVKHQHTFGGSRLPKDYILDMSSFMFRYGDIFSLDTLARVFKDRCTYCAPSGAIPHAL